MELIHVNYICLTLLYTFHESSASLDDAAIQDRTLASGTSWMRNKCKGSEVWDRYGEAWPKILQGSKPPSTTSKSCSRLRTSLIH